VTETSDTQSVGDFSDTPEEREFELRAAVGSYWTGGRLFIGIYAFFLASIAFAYFYLRSANNGQLWRPHNMTAPTGFGWGIFAATALAGLLVIYGQSRLRTGNVLDWEVAGWTALVSVLIGITLQVWQMTELPFFPGASGYSSSFIGWAVANIITLLIAGYWLETILARSLRLRSSGTKEAPAQLSPSAQGQLFRANVSACTYFWGFVVLGSAVFWVMFYLV